MSNGYNLLRKAKMLQGLYDKSKNIIYHKAFRLSGKLCNKSSDS